MHGGNITKGLVQALKYLNFEKNKFVIWYSATLHSVTLNWNS